MQWGFRRIEDGQLVLIVKTVENVATSREEFYRELIKAKCPHGFLMDPSMSNLVDEGRILGLIGTPQVWCRAAPRETPFEEAVAAWISRLHSDYGWRSMCGAIEESLLYVCVIQPDGCPKPFDKLDIFPINQ